MLLEPPDFLRRLLKSPVAVLGGGISGRGVLRLLKKLGSFGVVFDEKFTTLGIVNNFGPAQSWANRLVIVSPGFPPAHPWLKAARAWGCVCLSELDFASLFWQGQLIAVTGTNGKTTLTEFLAHALQVVGSDARATGNVGFPFSQLVAEADGGSSGITAVCEVSSFQAESLAHFRADATLWTNFAEDHLDRHSHLDAYFAAKWKLIERTSPGAVFVGESVRRFSVESGRQLPRGSQVFSEVNTSDPRLAKTVFAGAPQSENFRLAAGWWGYSGRPPRDLFAAARTYQNGPHRLSRVAEVAGVTWWNDSKATNFHAVEGALASFDCPVLLIAGGKSKGGDIDHFIQRIAPNLRHAFLLGDTKAALASACSTFAVTHTECLSLAEAVQRASELAEFGDHVLLSPGFASFDHFLNYEDRGNQFEALVNNLGATVSLR